MMGNGKIADCPVARPAVRYSSLHIQIPVDD